MISTSQLTQPPLQVERSKVCHITRAETFYLSGQAEQNPAICSGSAASWFRLLRDLPEPKVGVNARRLEILTSRNGNLPLP